MVKRKSKVKKASKQGRRKAKKTESNRTARITPETRYGQCSERLSGFGGVLPLVKFLDLIGFEESFECHYVDPKRAPKLGGYRMVLGILMLLYVGFQRLWHFTYIRQDTMLCGALQVKQLPAVSTFWRYISSLSIIQSQSLVRLGGELRIRVWKLCDYAPKLVTVNIDTTASTVYGDIQGAQQGHNKKRRGKKMLRPVLCFLGESREYLCGSQRRGRTIRNKEVVHQIKQFRKLLPQCVKQIKVHADA